MRVNHEELILEPRKGYWTVYDPDGNYLMTLDYAHYGDTEESVRYHLEVIVGFANNAYDAGVKVGRGQLQHEMRKLLGLGEEG